MNPNSANVFNTLTQANTYRDKFRTKDGVTKVGRRYVIVTREQAQRLGLALIEPKVRNYRNFERWRKDALAAGCKVRLTTRWVAGGGYHQAIHPQRGIVGFYNHGTTNGRKLNSGHLHV